MCVCLLHVVFLWSCEAIIIPDDLLSPFPEVFFTQRINIIQPHLLSKRHEILEIPFSGLLYGIR